MDFKGRVALVTGGSRGIGRAICIELARGGAHVVFSYAGNGAGAEETVQSCKALGVNAVAVQSDVTDSQGVKDLIDTVIAQFGRIDILVNNAGITKDGLLMSMKDEAFEQVIDTNLKGTFLTMKGVTRMMMKQKYGRIINLSSVVALRGNGGQANYCASKAGLIGLTKSVAKELGSRGITVNAIAPGFIETDMTAQLPETAKEALLSTIPAKRLGQPEDVAKAVAFLASEEASYITGHVLSVDGGMGM